MEALKDAMAEHTRQCAEGKAKAKDGPWRSEPDRVEFRHAGLDCMLLRAGRSLAWCGYVGIPEGHPLHGVSYGDGCAALAPLFDRRMKQPLGEAPGMSLMLKALCGMEEQEALAPSPDLALDVHGGITYSGACSPPICHMADEGAPPVWWFGFDCSHCNDLSPGYDFGSDFGSRLTYRDTAYARGETERLADQLAMVTA